MHSAMSDAGSAATTDAERLALVIGRLHRRLQSAAGLSHGLLSSLAVIAKRGPLRLSDLAQLEGVSAPTMTRAVAELESRGYVVRSPDPEDGRAVLIAAAEAGDQALVAARSARARVIAELLASLDAPDAAAIAAALPALERLIEPA